MVAPLATLETVIRPPTGADRRPLQLEDAMSDRQCRITMVAGYIWAATGASLLIEKWEVALIVFVLLVPGVMAFILGFIAIGTSSEPRP